MKFLIILLLFSIASLYGQSTINYSFRTDDSENGHLIEIDDDQFIYILSQSSNNGIVGSRLRKIDTTGIVLFDSLLAINAYPKDLLITTDNRIIFLLYERGQPINGGPDDKLVIGELLVNEEIIVLKENILNNTSLFIQQYRLDQLSDNSFAFLSDHFGSLPDSLERTALLVHLDIDFDYVSHVELPKISLSRARCFKVVEDDNVLIGSPGLEGAILVKASFSTDSIVWDALLDNDSTTFNRIYNPVRLQSDRGYGLITNFNSEIDSLQGIRYFNVGVNGEIQSKRSYPTQNWSPASFPSIFLDYCDRINVAYGIFDSDNMGLTRQILIDEEGGIQKDTIFDLAIGFQQARDVARLENGKSLMVSSEDFYLADSTRVSQVLLAGLVSFPKVLSNNSNTTQVKLIQMKIFPNPSNGNYVRVQIPGNTSQRAYFSLYDQSGKIVLKGEEYFTENTLFISLRNLTNGYYFIKVDTNNGSQMSKLVVKN
jgi:hypothetical protein